VNHVSIASRIASIIKKTDTGIASIHILASFDFIESKSVSPRIIKLIMDKAIINLIKVCYTLIKHSLIK